MIKSEDTLDTLIQFAVGRYIMSDGLGMARWRDGAGRRRAAAMTMSIPRPEESHDDV